MTQTDTIYCGEPPQVVGRYKFEVSEMMLYLYLPIKMPGDTFITLPDNLMQFRELIWRAIRDYGDEHVNKYIYVTTKTMWGWSWLSR